MSMPSDLISMLMNQGGGGVNPPLLDPRMQPPNPQPQMPEMGPEEAKVMSMFSPPKTPEEEDQIVSKWEQFTNQFKTKPGWDRALVAFGAQLMQKGDFGSNFGKGAAAYSAILAEAEAEARKNKIQELGIQQQARGIDNANRIQQENLDLNKQSAKLAQDQFGLQKLESEASRSLALENLGIKRRELAIAETSAKNDAIRTGMQNTLIATQIKKLEKEINAQGFFETTPGEPIGTTIIKTKANSLIKADPKIDPSAALNTAASEYINSAANATQSGQITNSKLFTEAMKVYAAGLDSVLPGHEPPSPESAINAAKTISAGFSSDPLTTQVKSEVEKRGGKFLDFDPATKVVTYRDKSGKLTERKLGN